MSDSSKHRQRETEFLQNLWDVLSQMSDLPHANSVSPPENSTSEPPPEAISDLVEILVDGGDSHRESSSSQSEETEALPSPTGDEPTSVETASNNSPNSATTDGEESSSSQSEETEALPSPTGDEPTSVETASNNSPNSATTTDTGSETSSFQSSAKSRRRRLQQTLLELHEKERQGGRSNFNQKESPSQLLPHSPQGSPGEEKNDANSPSVSQPVPVEAAVFHNQPTPEEWQQLEESVAQLRSQIQDLKKQVYEPTDLVNPLLPLIVELMESKINESKDDMFEVMVPVIDRAIAERGRQNRIAMSKALSHVIPSAISEHIHEDPEDVANALGPTMGAAIREQIRIERDAMVDALYPVIGNTVSKYMTEMVKSINDKIETTLSFEGVTRKMRARMQGVSEAELVFRESMKFAVRAIFLIQKQSGLAIAEAQPEDMEKLESDMIAGMLTAIRSFANDTLSVGTTTSELHEIEYDTFAIEIESAGYCYLAAILQGEVTSQFIKKMRRTLSKIIQNYYQPIKDFEGDPETVPEEIPVLLEELSHAHQEEPATTSRRHPPALLVIFLLLLAGSIFWGWRHWQQQHLVGTIEENWNTTPSLAIYQLQAKATGSKVVLSGKLPSASLRQQAENIAAAAVENRTVNNQIIAAEVPPYPEELQGELRRLTQLFNQEEGIEIATTYNNTQVRVSGQVNHPTDARRITKAMEEIPGLPPRLVVALQFGEAPLTTRLYFPVGSNQLSPRKLQEVLLPVVHFLQEHPQIQLTIIGHTDPTGNRASNEKLSQQRAEAVQKALRNQGIDSQRLQVRSIPKPPPRWHPDQPARLARVVRFETQFSTTQNRKEFVR